MNRLNRRCLFFFFPAFFIFLVLPTSCGLFPGKKKVPVPQREWARKEIRPLLDSMSLEEKASQVLMTGIDGDERFAPYLRSHFDGAVPGAILLFRYNIAESPRSVFDFLASCNDAFSSLGAKVPVLYAIDNEGGEVFRTAGLTTRIPSASFVASKFSLEEAKAFYESSGRQLSLMGIQLNLAPIAEAETSLNADFLGTRSYSKSVDTVVSYSAAAIDGFRSGGMLSAMKHFPGSGKSDPHAGISVLDVPRKEFDSVYVEPFRKLISVAPDAVLVSHCIVPSIEPDVPFCLSKKGVTGLLRDKLMFSGLVITDDIAMKALTRKGYSPEKAAVLALRAGCDMIMISDRNIRPICKKIADAARDDPAFASRLDEAVTRILVLKCKAGLVKTAQERYSESRMRSLSVKRSRPSFDDTEFLRERKKGNAILEEIHGR